VTAIGFVGLGTMGGRMVARLVAAGQVPLVYDLLPAARAAAEAAGARAGASPAAVVRSAEVVLSSLPMPADVEAVVAEALPALRRGAVWVDLSTIDPATARRLAARLAERGAHFLDGPVSGGPTGAEAGTLAVMVGGDADALARARPALEAFAGRIFHVGPVGAGSVVKLANQLLVGANTVAAMEALAFARRAGIDPQVAADVISASAGDSAMLRRSKEFVQTGQFPPAFALRLLVKDLRLYAGEAGDLATATPAGQPTLTLYEQALARGWGGDDYAAVLRLVEEGG
jgi:3-hydroxyisobutyrate dehydrogenase-like beta-hydroxyacid dehydrogenase